MAGEKILVIDSNTVSRSSIIETVLKPNGYVPFEAGSLEQGLSIAAEQALDLVLLAMQRPDVRPETLDKLVSQGRPVPALIIGTGRESGPAGLSRVGFCDVLYRPFEPDTAAWAIERLLCEARLRRERDELADQLAQTRRQLAEAETVRGKLEAVLRGAQDAVIVVDQDQQVVVCNPAACKALNIHLPATLGRRLSQAVQHPTLIELFEQSPAAGRPARAEVQLADGRTLQAQVCAIEGIGYAAVLRDITHLKELDRIKSEFVSVVSHDLRSPLTTIRGYVELLPRVGPLTPMQTDFVNRVGRGVKTITDLIGDLLDIGRIEAGLEPDLSPCQMNEVVHRAVEAVRMAAEEKQHTLTLDIQPGELPLVRGNARRLEQVVTNLVGNAVKYTRNGGKISVTLTADGPYLMLRVEDNGIGIPLEDQPRVFDKFYRVQTDETADISGTGLGLSIVKSVVEKHNGRVWVESEEGQGSSFVVLLPSQT